MRRLRTHALTADRTAQAYPLVQALLPGLTLEGWLDFAMPMVSPPDQESAGIMIVENEQGYIVGLCCYRVERDLEHGLTLLANQFVVLDPFGRDAVAETLVKAVELRAKALNCTAIHTNLPRSSAAKEHRSNQVNWLVESLCSRGHEIESLRLCKSLPNLG